MGASQLLYSESSVTLTARQNESENSKNRRNKEDYFRHAEIGVWETNLSRQRCVITNQFLM